MASRLLPGTECPRCHKLAGRPLSAAKAGAKLTYYRCEECPHVWIENHKEVAAPPAVVAYTFAITSRDAGFSLGQAVVCAEARYASVMRKTSPYPTRRFPSASDWAALELELSTPLPQTPLSESGALARLIAGEHAISVDVAYMHQERLPAGLQPAQLIEELDLRLRNRAEPVVTGH